MKKWEKFKKIEGNQNFPDFDKLYYECGDLFIIVDFFNGELKTVKCSGPLTFRVIDEGKALQTLCAQDFDGITWIFKTDSSLIDWFNFESESMFKEHI